MCMYIRVVYPFVIEIVKASERFGVRVCVRACVRVWLCIYELLTWS